MGVLVNKIFFRVKILGTAQKKVIKGSELAEILLCLKDTRYYSRKLRVTRWRRRVESVEVFARQWVELRLGPVVLSD